MATTKTKTATIRQLVYPDGLLKPSSFEVRRRRATLERQGFTVRVEQIPAPVNQPSG